MGSTPKQFRRPIAVVPPIPVAPAIGSLNATSLANQRGAGTGGFAPAFGSAESACNFASRSFTWT